MSRIIATTLLCLAQGTWATGSAQRTSDTCPTGFYRSGSGFCTPYSSQPDRQTITRTGDRCPVGWYRTGEHTCRAYRTRTQDRLVEQQGGGCPVGWYKSASGTCKQF